MITEGKYSIWFSTPIGNGPGMVEFGPNGALSGGDTTFSYIGNWSRMAIGSRLHICQANGARAARRVWNG